MELGIIGGGVMGEALLSRLLELGVYTPASVWVSNPREARRSVLATQYGVNVTADNQVVADIAKVLLLAVKPQMFRTAVNSLTVPNAEALIVSILAGISLQMLEAAFPNQPVIRAMPNTPSTVGAGMTAIAAGRHVQPHHLQVARQLFEAVGEVVELPEVLIDAATGVSGSGPAYVALMVEALSDGGVAAGLPRAIATQLAVQTVRGTAELLHATGMHPAELKDRVASPGGTTIAGIAQLEKFGFRSALIEAVKASYLRSKELGN